MHRTLDLVCLAAPIFTAQLLLALVISHALSVLALTPLITDGTLVRQDAEEQASNNGASGRGGGGIRSGISDFDFELQT